MKFLSKLAELFKDEEPVAVVEAPKPVELKKRTKKLVSKKETIDLGVTSVLLKFQDGRELITKVYGHTRNTFGNEGCDQRLDRNRYGEYIVDLVEPFFSNRLDTSLEVSERYISEIDELEITYVDCPRKPTVSFVGKVISAQIIKTEQCLEEVTKYSVEPI